MRTHLRLAAMLISLFVARLEAREFAVGDTIDLALPDGQPSFSLSIVAVPPAGIAGQSYIARDTQSQASAVVKPTNDGLRVTIDDFERQKIYSVRVKDGVVEATVRDTSGGDGDVCGTCGGDLAAPPQEAAPVETSAAPASTTRTTRLRSAMLGAGNVFPVAEQKTVVDILVAFDQGAKAWVDGGGRVSGDTITNFADYAVNKMNMVLEKSQLDDKFFYRLVGIVEVDASYDVIDNNLLDALRLRNNGVLAPVGAAREKCGADTITLLIDRDRNKSTTSGQGYEYLSNSWSYAQFDALGYTCNICDIKTVYERYTMSHETGHNMGCGHSNRQGKSSGPGCHPYSCGYHFVDAAGTNRYTIMAYDNTSPASGTYYPVPYFSSPDITPDELGVPVGTPTNNNRLTILNNYMDVAAWREHVVPYDWDVRFLDSSGNDIPNGAYFVPPMCVTLASSNPDAVIYYAYGSDTPTSASASGTQILLQDTRTITACAVVDGVAQSMRTVTFVNGLEWSGESGQNGNGVWRSGDSSVRAWSSSSQYFLNGYDTVRFPDIEGNAAPTVTVSGLVAPTGASFMNYATAYTFEKGSDDALIRLGDASFAPVGPVTFNVPVSLAAVSFTSPAGCLLTFNAPFGTNMTAGATYGHCTNMVVVGDSGTLTVAPGAGKTQVFDRFNNIGTYWNSATFRVGAGTVRFKGPINGGKGLFGSTKIAVGDGGNLVFDVGGPTGYSVNNSSLTIDRNASVTFNQMEHLRRSLYLNGGVIYAKRLDLMSNPGIYVGDDSSIEDLGGGYLQIRSADASFDVAGGKVLTLNLGTNDRDTSDANGKGLVKTGGGELAANRPLSHTGATVVSNGTLSVGYTSSVRVGLGWTVKDGAMLKVKDGCSLAVPTLALESGATLALSATNVAPLSATNNVSVAGVTVELSNASNLSVGASYPLLVSEGGISGAENVDMARLPALASGLEWRVEATGGTLYAKVVASIVQFVVARGETVNLADIPATVTSVIGEGTVNCGATLPGASLGWTSSDWKGTLVFEGLNENNSTRDFQFERYGNSASRILLRNCAISYLKNNNATFAGTLALEQDNYGHVAFTTGNGYSETYNVFGALEGDGAMSFTTGQRQGYVFGTSTNYSGSIFVGAQNNSGIVGGRYIVFGAVASAGDLPANTSSATITVKSGATASIGGGATWSAYHGVDIAGTLLVKGAGATLDCNASANMGLKLDDGATLRFEAADAKLTFAKAPQFAAGTVSIAFAAGFSPQGGEKPVVWPTNAVPGGAFAFADASLAAAWDLCKTAIGLVVKPKNRFDVPGSDVAYIAESASLDAWLDENNFELYELSGGTWQEFLGEAGANGNANWMNFALGLSAEDATDTFRVTIRLANGKVIVSPCRPVYDGLKYSTRLYGSESLSGGLQEIGVFDGSVLELEPFAGSDSGFYKAEISVKGR